MNHKLLQQALDALNGGLYRSDSIVKAIEALEVELAKPDPVVLFTDNDEGLWIQLECNGSYYSQNLSDSKTAKFFVNAYRGRK
jgi:hypothetical protein